MAGILVGAWRIWHDDEQVNAFSRSVGDIVLTWKCDRGHSISARGRVGKRPCLSCDGSMRPVTAYVCEEHGQFEVIVRFAENPSGTIRVEARRLPGGRWYEKEEDLRCPRCGKRMTRKAADDLSRIGSDDGRGGG